MKTGTYCNLYITIYRLLRLLIIELAG